MTRSTRRGEATGMIVELLAAGVGFDPGWGFSRWIADISCELLTSAGNVDCRSADARVAVALAEVVAGAPDPPTGLPAGVTSFGPELYARVAVSQRYSGWAPAPGRRRNTRRLVLLRCHIGKRRVAGKKKNAVLMQYRVWARRGTGAPKRVLEYAKAWPLLKDLNAEIRRQLKG